MQIGFTGSRRGMTSEQLDRLKALLGQREDWTGFHHGDCIGADCIAHREAQALDIPIIIHPGPMNPFKPDRMRANCHPIETRHKPDNPCKVLPGCGYLMRNTHIVQQSQLLIATPDSFHEILRSGTWATIRQAINLNKHVYIIWPDGKIRYIKPHSKKPATIKHRKEDK